MQSLRQYRQIGRDVERDWLQKQSQNQNDESKHGDSEDSDSSNHIVVEKLNEDDPIDPKNWPLLTRSANIAILSLLVFSQGYAGAADSVANGAISKDFGVSKVAENLSTAMYTFGIGSGCLFVGPISQTIGRNPTYLVGTFCYLFFVAGSALTPNYGGQIVCSYFVGLFASATLAINGASVQDQFRPVKRALIFPIIAWANVASPVIAPVVGGWVTTNPHLGWRWVHWITLIISGLAFLLAFLFMPETYLPVLLKWKAEHLRRVSGDDAYISKLEKDSSFLEKVKTVLPMPITLFSSEPIVAVLGGYMILLYILLFSFLSGFDYIFHETYNLSVGLGGSCFASIALGSTLFTLSAPFLYIWSRHKTNHIPHASISPEFRLWPAIATSFLLPTSLFLLGWTNYPSISIYAGLTACFLFGIVITALYVSIYEYIIDAYAENGAVALASITMARYFVAGGMVMASRPMYEGIGVHWTMTLLGVIATVLVPAPWVFWKYGRVLRGKSALAMKPDDE